MAIIGHTLNNPLVGGFRGARDAPKPMFEISDKPVSEPLLRRNVSDQEHLNMMNEIHYSDLGREADYLAHEIFTPDMVRESGTTYLQHAHVVAKGSVMSAMRDCCTVDECIQQYVVGLMHDAEEDVPGSLNKIRERLVPWGLREESLNDIDRLTRRKDEPYFDRVDVIIQSRQALRAKKSDSEHNSSGNENRHNTAQGKVKNSAARYALSTSMYDAILEGRFDPAEGGVKGYFKTIGQDTLVPKNRQAIANGFSNPDDILAILDERSPLVRQVAITVPDIRAGAARLRRAFQGFANKIAPDYFKAPEDLPPMDTSRTLTETTGHHPNRDTM